MLNRRAVAVALILTLLCLPSLLNRNQHKELRERIRKEGMRTRRL